MNTEFCFEWNVNKDGDKPADMEKLINLCLNRGYDFKLEFASTHKVMKKAYIVVENMDYHDARIFRGA